MPARQVGCRRLAHITGPERFEAVLERKRGFHEALALEQFEHPGYYLSGKWSEAWGRDAVAALFDTLDSFAPMFAILEP